MVTVFAKTIHQSLNNVVNLASGHLVLESTIENQLLLILQHRMVMDPKNEMTPK